MRKVFAQAFVALVLIISISIGCKGIHETQDFSVSIMEHSVDTIMVISPNGDTTFTIHTHHEMRKANKNDKVTTGAIILAVITVITSLIIALR